MRAKGQFIVHPFLSYGLNKIERLMETQEIDGYFSNDTYVLHYCLRKKHLQEFDAYFFIVRPQYRILRL